MGCKIKNIAFLMALTLTLSSCEKLLMEDEISPDAKNNFIVLSNIIKNKYSYLTYKNINWDSIVSSNRGKISNGMSYNDEFKVYNEMLFQLKDGHVNLNAGFNLSRNWQWYLDAETNFDKNVVERNYLGSDYFIAGGLRFTILQDGPNSFGYIYYPSFSSGMSYINTVKHYFNHSGVAGVIIDVRDNGGGYLANAEKLANHFTDIKRVGYQQYYKSGPAANDFDGPYKTYIEPDGERFSKPIIILTNRKCYSATSFFVTMMKDLPNVIVLGDSTGGGAGLPVDYTLPNGWYLRFSATRCVNSAGEDFELGVEPDVKKNLNTALLSQGIDSYIEEAKTLILQN